MKFEDKLKEMDNIIEKLQNPEIELEKAIELYKKGIKLNEECAKELEDVKLSIETIDNEPIDL